MYTHFSNGRMKKSNWRSRIQEKMIWSCCCKWTNWRKWFEDDRGNSFCDGRCQDEGKRELNLFDGGGGRVNYIGWKVGGRWVGLLIR